LGCRRKREKVLPETFTSFPREKGCWGGGASRKRGEKKKREKKRCPLSWCVGACVGEGREKTLPWSENAGEGGGGKRSILENTQKKKNPPTKQKHKKKKNHIPESPFWCRSKGKGGLGRDMGRSAAFPFWKKGWRIGRKKRRGTGATNSFFTRKERSELGNERERRGKRPTGGSLFRGGGMMELGKRREGRGHSPAFLLKWGGKEAAEKGEKKEKCHAPFKFVGKGGKEGPSDRVSEMGEGEEKKEGEDAITFSILPLRKER